MTVGFRLRGAAGNIQIDDQSAVMVVTEQGYFDSNNYYDPYPGNGNVAAYQPRFVVSFGRTYTTFEPPLVFLRFRGSQWNYGQFAVVLTIFSMIGSPGAWTGFNIGIGSMTSVPVANPAFSMDYMVVTSVPGPSGAKVGIRIRNKDTGKVMYESGWPIAKFVSASSAFGAAGRYLGTHGILRYTLGYPDPSAYFLANCISAYLDINSAEIRFLMPGIEAGYFPSQLTLYAVGNGEIPYQSFNWTALFCLPGS